MAEARVKDVFSLNELSETNSMLQEFNEFLVGCDDYDEIKVTLAVITVKDKDGVLIGTYTKYSDREDIKFEPNFDFGVQQFGD